MATNHGVSTLEDVTSHKDFQTAVVKELQKPKDEAVEGEPLTREQKRQQFVPTIDDLEQLIEYYEAQVRAYRASVSSMSTQIDALTKLKGGYYANDRAGTLSLDQIKILKEKRQAKSDDLRRLANEANNHANSLNGILE